MVRTLRFDRETLAAAASDEFLGATDLADLLVRRGVPFRESHGTVAGLVRRAVGRGGRRSDLTDADLAGLAPVLDGGGLGEVLGEGGWLEATVSIRALEPVDGIELMRARRGLERVVDLCSGPGKLTKALAIGLSLNETSLLGHGPIEILPRGAPAPRIVVSERIGITRAVELP